MAKNKYVDTSALGVMRSSNDGKRAPRPRDAATLVLVKSSGRQGLRVLMGQRNKGHKFFPESYVFPGGRVDRADGYGPSNTDMKPQVRRQLEKGASPHRARAIAMAAIRETLEETGLILGKPAETNGIKAPSSWQPFLDAGFLPGLDQMDYLYRAITPPIRPIRFNARFFLADGEAVEGTLGGSGELLYLDWLPIKDALNLPLPRITLNVLQDIPEVWSNLAALRRQKKTKIFHTLHGRRLLDLE